jgi:hypothetical protein
MRLLRKTTQFGDLLVHLLGIAGQRDCLEESLQAVALWAAALVLWRFTKRVTS